MSTPIVTEDLEKSFGKIAALKGLDLRAAKGVSGFVGPNGAGKTTTINILLGLLKPDFGGAYIFGMDCWGDSLKIRQRIGVLHEKPIYPGNFTGARYLEHIAHVYGISNAKTRIKEVLGEVGLSEARDRIIKTYSAGMTQRLGLAQALIGEPELVILDEPTANLDPLGRIETMEKIEELHQDRGISFFISTHILPELEKVCEWVSIIKDGIIVDQGTMDYLASKYSANIYKVTVSSPRLFAEKVQDLEEVQEASIMENTVYCRVKDVDAFLRKVPQLVATFNLELKSLQSLYGTLEEIFKMTIVGAD